jgi:hypothetical protein
MALLSYEHMFPSSRTSRLAQRAFDALRLTRSFLLLEDDYDVDWEVDQDEQTRVVHPHRRPLRGRRSPRRPGQTEASPLLCISPVPDALTAHSRPGHRRFDAAPAHRDAGVALPD